MLFESLSEYGIDWESGLSRCLNDRTLYAKLLSLFLKDKAFSSAESALQKKDYAAMFDCMHDLKGSSGNTGMTDLYNKVSALVETLRVSDISEEKVETQYAEIKSEYTRACTGIERLFSDNQEKAE